VLVLVGYGFILLIDKVLIDSHAHDQEATKCIHDRQAEQETETQKEQI